MEGTVSCAALAKSSLSGRMEAAQALSGVLLALFTLIHLLLVSTVLISPHLMDGLGRLLEALWLAQIGGPCILLLMIVHFVLAARKMPFQVGALPVFWSHSKEMRHSETGLWLVQVATALVVLVLGSIHVYTALAGLPITAASSAAREQGGWAPFYVVLLLCVGIHMGIGLFRVGAKYGYVTAADRALWLRRAWYLIAGYVGLGLLTMVRFHLMSL